MTDTLSVQMVSKFSSYENLTTDGGSYFIRYSKQTSLKTFIIVKQFFH